MNNLFNAVDEIFETLLQRYPILEASKADIWKAFELLRTTYENDKMLFVAGNGGSAADSEHIVGELMKSFMAKRKIDDEFSQSLCDMFHETGEQLASSLEKGLPAVSLPSLTALSTAIINDVDGKMIFAQTLNSIGRKDDLFLGISTSGNSKNIVYAMMVAKAKGLHTLGLTGENTCKLDELCDVVIHVPETETYKIQELHLPVYHALCAMLESYFFNK